MGEVMPFHTMSGLPESMEVVEPERDMVVPAAFRATPHPLMTVAQHREVEYEGSGLPAWKGQGGEGASKMGHE